MAYYISRRAERWFVIFWLIVSIAFLAAATKCLRDKPQRQPPANDKRFEMPLPPEPHAAPIPSAMSFDY